MKNYLLNFDQKLLRVIRMVGQEADRVGMSAYVVGGIVRDIILKKNNFDLDISIEGNAVILAKRLAKKTKARLTVYAQFKTASLQWPTGMRVDLATVRNEDYPYSGALPIVRAGTLREDLFRRDFTINAMALAINANCFGQLIDEFGGLKDLSNRKIKALHAQSFIDDPTRILRAVRFEQRLNFQIERQTLLKIKAALKKKVVAKVKPPRYFTEFKKILCEDDPVKSLKRLYSLKGLQFLNPKLKVHYQELNSVHGRIQNLKRKILYSNFDSWWLIYFMVLLEKFDRRVVTNILEKFHFTRVERKSLEQGCKMSGMIKRLSAKRLTASQIYQILKPQTRESIIGLRVRTSNTLLNRRIDRYLSNDLHVKLKINGEDLKKLGIISGVKIGRILESVLYSKIDRQVRTKQDELNKALQLNDDIT